MIGCALLKGNFLQLHKPFIRDIIRIQFANVSPRELYVAVDWGTVDGSWALILLFSESCSHQMYRRTNLLKLPRVHINRLRNTGPGLGAIQRFMDADDTYPITVYHNYENLRHFWYIPASGSDISI